MAASGRMQCDYKQTNHFTVQSCSITPMQYGSSHNWSGSKDLVYGQFSWFTIRAQVLRGLVIIPNLLSVLVYILLQKHTITLLSSTWVPHLTVSVHVARMYFAAFLSHGSEPGLRSCSCLSALHVTLIVKIVNPCPRFFTCVKINNNDIIVGTSAQVCSSIS